MSGDNIKYDGVCRELTWAIQALMVAWETWLDRRNTYRGVVVRAPKLDIAEAAALAATRSRLRGVYTTITERMEYLQADLALTAKDDNPAVEPANPAESELPGETA